MKLNALSSAEMSEQDSQAGPRFNHVHRVPGGWRGGWGLGGNLPVGVLIPEVAAGRGLVLPGLSPLPFWADPALVPAHWFLLIPPRGLVDPGTDLVRLQL